MRHRPKGPHLPSVLLLTLADTMKRVLFTSVAQPIDQPHTSATMATKTSTSEMRSVTNGTVITLCICLQSLTRFGTRACKHLITFWAPFLASRLDAPRSVTHPVICDGFKHDSPKASTPVRVGCLHQVA